MVMAQSLIQVLHQSGSVVVDLLAPPATASLGERMPGVSETFVLEVGHGQLGWAERRRMANRLRSNAYDRAIVLPNSFKSALVPFWASIPTRSGWTGESRYVVLNDRRRLDRERLPLMVERFVALAGPEDGPVPDCPAPRLAADEERLQVLRETFGLTAGSGTALCPGAEFGPAKRWPARHFAEVARAEIARGRQVWLLGSPGDAAVCREIAGAAEGVVDLAGRTSLIDAVDIIAGADRVVCNDSGLMHVAAALDRELVALFGSTSPDFTPPLGEHNRVLALDLPCRPCFQRTCPLGHLQCLEDLSPERVIEVL